MKAMEEYGFTTKGILAQDLVKLRLKLDIFSIVSMIIIANWDSKE